MGAPVPGLSRLTERQQAILDWIGLFTSEHGYPPTVREIGAQFGIRSPNGVQAHLRALITKGLLKKSSFSARSLVVVGAKPAGEEGERKLVAVNEALNRAETLLLKIITHATIAETNAAIAAYFGLTFAELYLRAKRSTHASTSDPGHDRQPEPGNGGGHHQQGPSGSDQGP